MVGVKVLAVVSHPSPNQNLPAHLPHLQVLFLDLECKNSQVIKYLRVPSLAIHPTPHPTAFSSTIHLHTLGSFTIRVTGVQPLLCKPTIYCRPTQQLLAPKLAPSAHQEWQHLVPDPQYSSSFSLKQSRACG